MKRYGFFGGCFNPPTIAHLELAKLAIKECNLDKVIYVPMSDMYKKEGLVSQKHRYNMLKLITKDEPNLEISDFEFNEEKRLYAIDAFNIINERYDCEKFFIMGSDNYIKIKSWKNSSDFDKFNFIILNRDSDILNYNNICVIGNKNFHKISSSEVREKIKNNENVKEFITEDVYQYIKLNNLYLENED